MFRTLVCCLLLFLLPSAASAQEWARKMFEQTRHDFGNVARGNKTEFHFKFNNIYLEDVHVASVRSSCGCTTPLCSKEWVKTYEDSSIVAVFNTHQFLGPKNATITVTFDKPFFAEVQLQVSGNIRSDIVVSPGAAEFGSIDSGKSAERQLSVAYAGNPGWKITGVKSSNPHVSLSLNETNRSGRQVTYDVRVTLAPETPVGYLKEQVLLITNDERSPHVPIDVEARIVSSLTVSPASLFLGALERGQRVTKQLVIQGKRPFRLTQITADGGAFEFKPTDALKPVHLVPIVFTAGDETGKFTYKIRIETDLPTDGVQEIEAHGQVSSGSASK